MYKVVDVVVLSSENKLQPNSQRWRTVGLLCMTQQSSVPARVRRACTSVKLYWELHAQVTPLCQIRAIATNPLASLTKMACNACPHADCSATGDLIACSCPDWPTVSGGMDVRVACILLFVLLTQLIATDAIRAFSTRQQALAFVTAKPEDFQGGQMT